jgi:beta-galactosidase
MRAVYNFNQDWRYAIGQLDDDAPDTAFQTVTLPHTNKIVPLHYFENTEYAFISTYRKRFRLPEARAERRVWLDFDGAMIASTVSINGYRFTEHRGGYTPFALDITDYLVEDG